MTEKVIFFYYSTKFDINKLYNQNGDINENI